MRAHESRNLQAVTMTSRTQPQKSLGLTIFMTGLSGAGKSTIATALVQRLEKEDSRNVSLLDGDVIRRILSSELGYSREHRDLNILRIGYVASEITKHGGIAVCAVIAPYVAMRRQVRSMVNQHGDFVEVYVATPLEVCEQRDPKGLYSKARAGLIKEFTGVNDPYEVPTNAEIVLDASRLSVRESTAQIMRHILQAGPL
jgi:sulfate adenylyltransferase